METITSSFTNSLITDSSSLIKEYLEMGIDLVIKDDILKDIPVINTITGGSKVLKTIRERNYIKNLIQFINELNTGKINKEKLLEYKNELKKDQKRAEKKLGRVLLILDDIIDNEKNTMIGKLFKAYINQNISWNDFCELTEVVRRLFVQDIPLLKGIYHGGIKQSEVKHEMYRIDRIQSLGITGLSPKMMNSTSNNSNEIYVIPNKIGRTFMNIVF